MNKMKTDKPVLIIASHIGAGCTGLRTSAELLIASMKENHPDLVVVDNIDDARNLGVDLEPEKDRGILISPIKKFELNAMDIKNYHEIQPEIKITHKGEQIKSARNIRREKERNQKKYR